MFHVVCRLRQLQKRKLHQPQQTHPARKQTKKKKNKYEYYEGAPDNAYYFLFDVETSGSKRNFDKIIAMSFMAHDETGRFLGAFSQKVNPDSVIITHYVSKHVHSKLTLHFLDVIDHTRRS